MSEQEYINDLVKAALEGPALHIPKKLVEREIEAFILALNIRIGINAVPADHVYGCYREWTHKPIGANRFFELFNKHFRSYHKKGRRYYKLEADSFNLPSFYSMFSDPRYLGRKSAYRNAVRNANYIGVYKQGKNRYTSKLLLPSGKYLPLGIYKTAFEAAHSYDEAALQVYGKNAVLNFPRKWKDLINGKKNVPLIYRNKQNKRWYQNSVKEAKKEQEQYSQSIEALRREAEDTTK